MCDCCILYIFARILVPTIGSPPPGLAAHHRLLAGLLITSVVAKFVKSTHHTHTYTHMHTYVYFMVPTTCAPTPPRKLCAAQFERIFSTSLRTLGTCRAWLIHISSICFHVCIPYMWIRPAHHSCLRTICWRFEQPVSQTAHFGI